MCLSIILLLFSNIDFFVPLFVIEISHSLLELRQLAPVTAPVYLRQLAPVNTGANWRTGAETDGNWSPPLAETGAKTGAYWRRLLQFKPPSRFSRNLDLISKKSYGKWKYGWYLSFHDEIGTECDHIDTTGNQRFQSYFLVQNCWPMLQNRLDEGGRLVGWKKNLRFSSGLDHFNTECFFGSIPSNLWIWARKP